MFSDLVSDLDHYSVEPDLLLNVPYVPTDEKVVDEMLSLADVGRRDVLYDLGSGDGRIVVAAAMQRDARAVGIELDPLRVADAMEYAGSAGVEYMVDFVEDDIFSADISEATVVTLYLLDSINVELRPRLLSELAPGTRIVSHAFNMGDWQADERRTFSGAIVYLWIVPARVAGTWEWPTPDGGRYRVTLEQKYQHVTASAWRNGRKARVKTAKLSGSRLTLLLRASENALLEQYILEFANGRLVCATADEETRARAKTAPAERSGALNDTGLAAARPSRLSDTGRAGLGSRRQPSGG
ncbi:class I SAM-dependent methyltransferase [Halomonas piscis]|uniref:class I SAM-dependent methyltransferase n=1 Tax=Halomonas piscis TaxID=3031727 RepID=UPI00289E68A6|nr:class I SAM-dependent methyltransferase [Halomonas piscis]